MDITQDISKLIEAQQSDKLEIYPSIIKKISDLREKSRQEFLENDVDSLFCEIMKDLKSENQAFVELLLNELKLLLRHDLHLKVFFSEDKQRSILQSIISLVKVFQEEKVILLCFMHLDDTLLHISLENADTEDLLNKTAEILNRKTVPVSVYIAACNFIHRIFKEKEDKVSSCMHIVPKLVFLPLSHSSAKVREVAEKTLDKFPKFILYSEDAVTSGVLLKIVKEPYCKELLLLMKDKLEQYVLKVWKHVVNALGKNLHSSLPQMTPFFQVIEKGFKSPSDDVCKTAFHTWKFLISNFALDDNVLNDSKKLRFLLKPFKNLSKSNESVSSTVCDTWWHLVWSLNHNVSSRFTEVCLPLLEFTVGKVSTGMVEKPASKGIQLFLVKKGYQILLRLLEQPPNTAFVRISSPKKLPPLPYPALQAPLNLKVIARHLKEILSMIRTVIEAFGNSKDMTNPLDCLMKSVLFVVSSVIEDNSKESVEAVVSYISLVSDITESRICPSSTCLKCIDSLSKLPKSTLVSHCFNCGTRNPQDILCVNLLKLLFNPYLLEKETSNKRYLPAYNRLIQAGVCESLNPLLMAQKFIHILKNVIVPAKHNAEFLFELWSGIASPLLVSIEKTQEVNQGDKQDHDFSCLYNVLLCPFEPMFPTSVPQLYTKPVFRLWTNLYKTFVRSAELVSTTLPNEACEHFCAKLKNIIKDDVLKEPQSFENFCHLLQVVLESVDFASLSTANSQGFASLLTKRKKPLGNLLSLVDLLSLMLSSFYTNFIDLDEEVYQSCTPRAQKRGHVFKAAMPLDIMKTVFQNLKSGSIIPFVLEELLQPLSKFFSASQKKIASNVVGIKLETVFNVLMTSIEMYYLGPYDSDFLSMMSPLLESCFGHSRRQIKDRCRRFWFATFAPVSSSLKYPESLKNVMKKTKLPLIPDENISPVDEFSFTTCSVSAEESVINFETAAGFKHSFEKPTEVGVPKEAKVPSKETEPINVKENKASIKMSVDELPSNEFVKIDTPTPVFLTPRRRSIRMRKSFVPALYNDLSQSQDTTTLGGSSESFDNSSCEIMEFKSQEDFNKPSTSSKKEVSLMNDIPVMTLSSDNDHEPKIESNIEVISNEKEVISEVIKETDNVVEVISDPQKKLPVLNSNSIEDGLVNTKSNKISVHEAFFSDVIEINSSQETKDAHTNLSNEEKSEDKNVKVIPTKSDKPTSFVKKIPRKSLLGRRKKVLSETFSVQSPKSLVVEPAVSNPNQSCIEIIDIDDSEEIIPSSQSSSESESSKQLLTVEGSARTSGVISFNTPVGDKVKSSEPLLSLSVSSPAPMKHRLTLLATDDGYEECPETPLDLLGSSEGTKEHDVEIQSQEPAPVEDFATVMPLKSSENLLSCEEPNTKTDSQEIKAVLSDILKTSETKGQNVAENTPPLFDDVFVVQNTLLESETKSLPYTESRSLNVELKLQTASEIVSKSDNSKATRTKSVRIAARKSLDTTGKKKVLKKATKRKSMADLSDVKKSKGSTLDIVPENVQLEDDKITPDSSNQADSSSEGRKKIKAMEESTIPDPLSVTKFDDNSLIDDIKSVLSDIKEKLEFDSQPNSFDEFSLHVMEQCPSKRLCLNSSVSSNLNSESNEKQRNSKRKYVNKLPRDSLLYIPNDKDMCESSDKMDETPGFDMQNGCSTQPSFTSQQITFSNVNSSKIIQNDTEKSNEELQCPSNNYKSNIPLLENESAKISQVDSDLSSKVDLVCSDMEVSSHLSEDSKETCHLYDAVKTHAPNIESLNTGENIANLIPEFQDNEKQCLSSDISETKVKKLIENVGLLHCEFDRVSKDEQFGTMYEDVNNSIGSGFLNKTVSVSVNLNDKTSSTSQDEKVLFDEALYNSRPNEISAHDKIPTKSEENEVDTGKVDSSVRISPVEVKAMNPSKSSKITMDVDSCPDDMESPDDLDETSEIIGKQNCSHKLEAKLAPTGNTKENSPEHEVEELDCSQFPMNSNGIFDQDENDLADQYSSHLPSLVSENGNGTVSSETSEKDNICIQNSVENLQSETAESDCKETSMSGELEDSEMHSSAVQNTPKDALGSFTVYDCGGGINGENSPEMVPSDASEIIPNDGLTESSKFVSFEVKNENDVISESIRKATDMIVEVISNHQKQPPVSSSEGRIDGTENDKIGVNEVSLGDSAGNKKLEGTSRKRKTKCPVRSPFNFRQRSNVLVSMVQRKPEDSAENKSFKRNINKKPAEDVEKRIKILDFDSKDKVRVPVSVPMSNVYASPCKTPTSFSPGLSDVETLTKKSVELPETSKVRMNYDELTSVNTRCNASMATQTRRLKLLATVQQSVDSENEDSPEKEEVDAVIPLTDVFPVITGSILKKRKSSDFTSSKKRRVTFSDPLYEERLFRKDENVIKCMKIVSQPRMKEQTANSSQVKVVKASTSCSILLSTEEIPSSHEYENSDSLTDYSNLPVSPLLGDCKESVCEILDDLTTPAWVQGLDTLLNARRIKTIGDLCKLNIHELKALPFRSPKVLNLHKALVTHLNRTQEETLEKLKTIDDWCSSMVTSDEPSDVIEANESQENNDVNMDENIPSEVVESLARELLCNERIKHLPTQTLVLLADKCFGEVTQRLKNS